MEVFCLLKIKDCNYYSLGCLSQFQSWLFQPSSHLDQICLEKPDLSPCNACVFKLFNLTIQAVCYRRLCDRNHSIQQRTRLLRSLERVVVAKAELALQPKSCTRHTKPPVLSDHQNRWSPSHGWNEASGHLQTFDEGGSQSKGRA